MEISEIPIDHIKVSQFNTRKDLTAGTEDAGLEDLTNNIREKGLLSPVIVRSLPDGMFDLVAGQRRYLACTKLGMPTIPAVVRDNLGDADATTISLIENIHRANMHPLDKARAYQHLNETYGSHSAVARHANVSISTVRRYLSLLALTPAITGQISTAQGPVGVGTLSKLAEMFDRDHQEEALALIEGFRQEIQLQLLRESRGNLDRLRELREKAMEGAFDLVMCSEGLCFSLSMELKAKLSKMVAQGEGKLTLSKVRQDIVEGN